MVLTLYPVFGVNKMTQPPSTTETVITCAFFFQMLPLESVLER
jgi:hypothetical protein